MAFHWPPNSPLKRICTLFADHRVRAAVLAFVFPNCSISLVEPHLQYFLFSLLHHFMLAIICLGLSPLGRNRWKFTIQSFLLGVLSGWSIAIALLYPNRLHTLTFCVYVYFMTLFHFSEFLMTALTNIDSLRPDSFLLNHSPAYWTAAVSSWLEFWVRAWIFPSFCSLYLSSLGILCCIIGELFRKLAMCHASVGFTHQIAIRKHKDHQLCTKGVYSLEENKKVTFLNLCYLGWMVWSVGTQLVLCNPICVQAYAYFAYRFFKDRIWEEERYLIVRFTPFFASSLMDKSEANFDIANIAIYETQCNDTTDHFLT